MFKLFSERLGLTPPKTMIQINSIDDELRHCLWNLLCEFYWDQIRDIEFDREGQTLIKQIWNDYYKLPYDSIPFPWEQIYKHLRKDFYASDWKRVYNFIEFVAIRYPKDYNNDFFRKACNEILERELSAYRFVNQHLTQITSETEIQAIDKALLSPFKTANIHLKKALEFLSDRKQPDYRNSIKESISAVESICITLSGINDFEKALIKLAKKIQIHPQMEQGFKNLFRYTSDEDGVRHAAKDEPTVSFDEAKFMLVTCSAFVNYLTPKAEAIKN